MPEFTPKQLALIKEIVLGTLRAAIRQNDEQLIRDLGEILEKLQ